MLTLITGGVRCGKSRFAQSLLGPGRALMVATAEARDTEMAARIAVHRAARPASWVTREAPLEVCAALEGWEGSALLDCLTLWVSNLIEAGFSDQETLSRVERLALLGRRCRLVVVSNEVGWGVVPASPLARRYRDLLGLANQHLAAQAEQVYLMAAGLALPLKPTPQEERP